MIVLATSFDTPLFSFNGKEQTFSLCPIVLVSTCLLMQSFAVLEFFDIRLRFSKRMS
jgi:hypothetical protein